MKYIFIVITVIGSKFLYNLFKLIENKKLHKIWSNYFKNIDNDKDYDNAITYTIDIQNHFKQANIKDASIPISQGIGFGQVAVSHTTAFTNLFVNDKRCYQRINDAFLEAKGVYRSRMKESFKISYWIKLIIFLPKNIISYLGLNTETIFTKIFQVMFWLIDSIIFVIYKDNILSFFQNLFEQLFSFFTK